MRKAEGSFQRPDTPEANSLIPCYDELFKIPVYKKFCGAWPRK